MRVVLVSTWFPTTTSPVSGIFVARDAQALAAHPGVAAVDVVHLVPTKDGDGVRRASVDGVRVLRIPMNPLNPVSVLRAARALRGAVRGADVVHSAAVSALLPVALARAVETDGRSAPWAHTEHWSGLALPEILPSWLRGAVPVVLGLLRLPDVVTVVSEFAARPVRAARGARPTRVVPCVVPSPEPSEDRAGRHRDDDVLAMVAVGRLAAGKDPETAIRTVAELRSRGIATSLTWVGGGPLSSEMERLVSELDLDSLVRLMGTLEPTQVAGELAGADLFLLPTRGDTFCVAIAEALTHGLPVVAGVRGGHGEYLDELVGELVTEQSPQAYADAVERVWARCRDLTRAEVAATLGERFSPQAVADRYVEVYRSLCSR